MTRKSKLYVGEVPGGFAVLVEPGKYKVGPNPLTMRAAECVQRVFEVIDIDCSAPQRPTSAHHNELAVGGCSKLKKWASGRCE